MPYFCLQTHACTRSNNHRFLKQTACRPLNIFIWDKFAVFCGNNYAIAHYRMSTHNKINFFSYKESLHTVNSPLTYPKTTLQEALVREYYSSISIYLKLSI